MVEISKITVLIVDDHAMVRQGVRAFLETSPEFMVVGSVGSGLEAIQIARDFMPDVALVDIVMPGMDGVKLTSALRNASPHTRVIIFTSFHDDEYIFPAIRAGALSYLKKDSLPGEIGEAIRKAAWGEAILDSRVAARIVQDMQQGGERDQVNAFTILSERELEVLRLIASGGTNQEIAEKLMIGESTVKSHVGNILGKLHLADRTQAAVYAWAKGIVRR